MFVSRVGFHHFGIYFFAPLMDHFAEFGGLFGHFRREVLVLADVVFEVVQLHAARLEEFDEFVIARANRRSLPWSQSPAAAGAARA